MAKLEYRVFGLSSPMTVGTDKAPSVNQATLQQTLTDFANDGWELDQTIHESDGSLLLIFRRALEGFSS